MKFQLEKLCLMHETGNIRKNTIKETGRAEYERTWGTI